MYVGENCENNHDIIISKLFVISFSDWSGKKLSEYRLKTAKITDERIRLMDEIISGIQIIKMYTWENPFAKLIEQTRKFVILFNNVNYFSIFTVIIHVLIIIFIYVFIERKLSKFENLHLWEF